MQAICEHLEAVTAGQIKKLIINVPPGTAKSTLVSVLWPTWEWGFRPEVRWMFASYREQLSLRDSGRRRDVVISSDWYQARWGDQFQLVKDNERYFTNTKQGSMYATSTGGTVTGFRGHRGILDDPHDPEGAISEVQRGSTTEWLNLTWPSRLDDTPWSGSVLVMQRLHTDDATGLYLKQGGHTHLKIPMRFKGRKTVSSLGWSDPRSTIGTLIDTSVHSEEYVKDQEIRLGPYGISGQHDQEPMPLGGGMIKTGWFGRWLWSPNQPEHIQAGNYLFDPMRSFRFCTVDLAMTEKTIGPKKLNDPDWTVMAAWACLNTPAGAMLVLLDMIRIREEGPESLPRLEGFHAHWKFHVIGVEDIAEKAWYQFARERGLPVREVSTSKSEDVLYTIDKDKVARAVAATVLMARPDRPFYVPEYAPWLAEFLHEIASFPNGTHDDQVDCVSMACAIAEKYKGGSLWLENTTEAPKQRNEHTRRSDDEDQVVNPLAGWSVGT